MKKLLILAAVCCMMMACGQKQAKDSKDTYENEPRPVVVMQTTMGDITLELFNETPKHRDNFLKLVDEQLYDSLLFHRVIEGFMIQGGDPDSKYAAPGVILGEGDLGYTVPAEFKVPYLLHDPYMLAAARMGDDVNPEKASSACQFYITHKAAHFLDGNYTVFGRVLEGQEVVDRIATVQTDANDRPLEDVRILSVSKR